MDNVSRETFEAEKAAILARTYDEIGVRDIAIVYLDLSDSAIEAEFFYPHCADYRVFSVPRSSRNPGLEIGRLAVDHWEATT